MPKSVNEAYVTSRQLSSPGGSCIILLKKGVGTLTLKAADCRKVETPHRSPAMRGFFETGDNDEQKIVSQKSFQYLRHP